ISASIKVSGGDSRGAVSLSRDGMTIGMITANPNGTNGSISGGTLQPGHYILSGFVDGSADSSSPGGFSCSLNISVSTTPGGDIRWINPAGGDFNVTTNWDPQLVPAFSDTAVFDLIGGVPITIQAMNNSVKRWIIRHMPVHLAGSAQV